ncbi:MAG TPA: hypothetical protein VKE98_16840, partial [Gemmataceae bacterium]|nr:hypothetical protein [Gemmataceae bacterium]
EAERLQPFTFFNLYGDDAGKRLDLGRYYKNHGYQIDHWRIWNETYTRQTDLAPRDARIQFAPVFVSPTMRWRTGGSASTPVLNDPLVDLGWSTAFQQQAKEGLLLGTDWEGKGYLDMDELTWGHLPLLERKSSRARRLRPNNSLLYQRPIFTGDTNLFSDLTIYAPGLNTSAADIQSVLEAEAKLTPVVQGTIDPAAKKLIDKARSGGWQAVTIPANPSLARRALTIHANGSGQYVFERTLWSGLRETVVCDGKTLLHLYPEIGLGAKRSVSRYHRAELAGMVPWTLPPVEDLTRGADVKAIAANIVALMPPKASLPKNEKSDNALHVHLVFADNGRLRERRIVLMPSQKTIYREVYRPGGTVTWFDDQDQQIAERKLTARRSAAPDLEPDTARLVLVPMPLRRPDRYQAQVTNLSDYTQLDKDLVIGVIASNCWQQTWAPAQQAFQQRFNSQRDRRLGFYVLLAGAGVRPSLKSKGQEAREPLYQYLTAMPQPSQPLLPRTSEHIGPKGSFLQRLASLRELWLFFNSDEGNPVPAIQPAPDAKPNPEDKLRLQRWQKLQTRRSDAFEFLQDCPAPFAFALLATMEDRAGNDRAFQQKLSEQFARLADEPGLGYAARYEQARCFLNGESKGGGGRLFEKLYADMRKDGALPLIDSTFVHALEFNPYGKLISESSVELIKDRRFAAVLTLAWQNTQLGQHELANDLVSSVLAKVTGWQKPPITLSAIDFLIQNNKLAQADSALQSLLADEKLASRSGLWRLGADIAQRRGITSRAIQCLETALDMEYRELPEVINVQKVREDYTKLLTHYHQLAVALTALENDPPKNFVARVVRAADRWRALDSDGAQACQLAAKTLQAVGARELAWDYLTTPIALKPNESAPWLQVANAVMESDLDLADRAFALAFKAEPTNAQILWDHAQCLHQYGRFAPAQQLYRQITETDWQPRFQNLREQARLKLER